MTRLETARANLLRKLADENPGAAPYTLALLLDARYGHRISGAQAARLLTHFPDDKHPDGSRGPTGR